ncbi:MAG TPA: hypothetical protein VNO30_26610 [Kofleriaceae bacterium]|nr:hypothetical protein [Kofleriaceae bacterium]
MAAFLIGLAACGGGGNDNVVIIDSTPAPMLCDPRAQTGCETGEKCATRFLQTEPTELAEIACVPEGIVEIDGSCTYGPAGANGYSNCKSGGECVNGICKQICDHQGGNPKCDTNHACSRYENIFESNNMTVAGVCDPRCDPLTQALAIGVKTAACGSTDPAMADNGCFTFDGIDFTCARIPTAARNLTDRMRGYGPASGGVYINGCAAGYLPLLIEQTGSMVGICSGVCAPAKTDNTQTTNAAGDPAVAVKLHNKAMPEAGDGVCIVDKKGSAEPENCHYMWFYNVTNNMIVDSPYNDTTGVCFAYGKYKVTLNGVQQGFPKCEQLPPAGATPDGIYGRANEWPCVPSTEVAVTAAKKLKNPVMKDFHLGARPGVGVRHILRQE